MAEWQAQGSADMNPLQRKPAAYVSAGDGGNYLYKGSTRELRARIAEHLSGRVPRTCNRRPFELVYFEYCTDYTEARRRENWLKSGKGREFLKRHLIARVAEWQTQRT
jgi:putative endonuclease